MKNIQVKDIVRECNGSLVFGDENIECINFSTDTRKIENGDVYIGLKGEKFDGSKFFKDALEKGAKVCILQNIAKYKRSLYNIPVIAITGSVGKTSTKDMVASIVSTKYKTLK